jgi:hypothetical protein
MKRLLLFAIWLVCLLCAIVALPWMLACLLVDSPRAWTIALGFDRVGNALTGGVDAEYLSARANRVQKEGRVWACVLCRLLDRIEPGHCERFDPPTPPADAGKL